MPPASRFLNHSPRWRQTLFRGRPRSESEKIIASWIEESGSLTERLIQRVGQGFRVVVLQQYLGSGYAEERRALGLARTQRAIIREVARYDQPVSDGTNSSVPLGNFVWGYVTHRFSLPSPVTAGVMSIQRMIR